MSNEINTNVCHILTVIDGATEEIIEVIEIKNFDLMKFRAQFDVSPETDPSMLERYGIGPDDAEFVCQALERHVPFEFSKYAYFIEAAQKQ
jgi:hypothetical protein